MKIESRRLGTVEIEEEKIILFPSGLIGLVDKRRFVLMELGKNIPMGWLQCLDDPDFGLPVSDPGLFVRDYQIELAATEVQDLAFHDVAEGIFLIVTTIGAGGSLITGNLRAPLVINSARRLGKQVVLNRPDLDFRALIDPVVYAKTEAPEEIRTEEILPIG